MKRALGFFSIILISFFFASIANATEIIKFEKGKFTNSDTEQYLAIDKEYENRSHVEGFEKAFILDKQNQKLIELWQGSNLDFYVIDIEEDGKKEIWLTNWDQIQGYKVMMGKLISIIDDNPIVLYSYKGFDNSSNYNTPFFTGDLIYDKHYTSFADIDDDNTLEIIDYEVIKSPLGFHIIINIFKLIDNIYQKI